jgi:hypothetical protein
MNRGSSFSFFNFDASWNSSLTPIYFSEKTIEKGDRIAIGYATDHAAGTGSPQWTVTDLTL